MNTEQRTHAYLRYDAARMRAWRKTRALQTGAWVVTWVEVIGTAVLFLL